jgi:paraquat-inducible protein A
MLRSARLQGPAWTALEQGSTMTHDTGPGGAAPPRDAGTPADLVACHDCDLLQRRRALPRGSSARCGRCGAVLYRAVADVLDRTLAFAIASLLLVTVVVAFPFMEFRFGGRVQVNHLASGAVRLWSDGEPELAVLVFLTSVLGPVLLVAALLGVCLPLRLGRRARWIAPLCRLLGRLKPWSMLEVYLLGVIVSIVKLSQMAELVLGPAAYAFFALILTLTAAIGAFDARVVWERLARR